MTKTLTGTLEVQGKTGGKIWAAIIVGLDKQFGLNRVFVEKSETWGNSRQTTNRYNLTEGLYQTSEGEFWILCEKNPESPLLRIKTTKERATKMAELMEEGMAFGPARTATK